MSYSRIFSPERYAAIANVITVTEELKPGEAITITSETPETMSVTRNLLYDYLFHMCLKGKFRIKALDSKTLMIRRLGFRTSPKVENLGERNSITATQHSGRMVERLIELWGETEAEVTLKEWIKAKLFSPEEGRN